ncbi:hypothetical protein E3N88_20482 [Mikania micrantha]|uniref:Uncharacterized protein n=1 Tax=Mikania micrantha TaxID=192012 RepID=A0A5N6NIA7_9ASTR|nr:hypothetical protein E3N88_20482 [Mikania micrantha]
MLTCRETMTVVEKFAKIDSNNEIGLIGLNRDPSRYAMGTHMGLRGSRSLGGTFEFHRKESRYVTTDHLPPSRYAACFGNRMIILIAAVRGGPFWTVFAEAWRRSLELDNDTTITCDDPGAILRKF